MAAIIPGKLIYLAHARTASIATCDAIARLPGGIRTQKHHITLDEMEGVEGNELIVSTVRNHFDALVSWWFAEKIKWPDFGCFLDAFTMTSKHIAGKRLFGLHRIVSNVTMRYEQLQHDLNTVTERVQLPQVMIIEVNVTKDKEGYRQYYTPSLIKKVQDFFGDEMKDLGYYEF